MPKRPVFGSIGQFLEVLRAARQARREGAQSVGLFGSRRRGDYKKEDADADVMVVREGASNLGHYDFKENDVHVVTTPPTIEGDSANSQALRKMREETRWLWKKKE